jgi:hypothetical protein
MSEAATATLGPLCEAGGQKGEADTQADGDTGDLVVRGCLAVACCLPLAGQSESTRFGTSRTEPERRMQLRSTVVTRRWVRDEISSLPTKSEKDDVKLFRERN